MTEPTHAPDTFHHQSDLIDLGPARAFARGSSQKLWLDALTGTDGLRVAAHCAGRWGLTTYDRIGALLRNLWTAGYDLERVPGPRGGRGTWYLRGYQPEQVTLRRVVRALGYHLTNDQARPWEPQRLITMLAAEQPETITNVNDLLNRAGWAAWQGVPARTPARDVLDRILRACRPEPATPDAAPDTRGSLLAQILNASRGSSPGTGFTLEEAAIVADAISVTRPA